MISRDHDGLSRAQRLPIIDCDGLTFAQKARLDRVLRSRHFTAPEPQKPFLGGLWKLPALFLCVWLLFAAGINFAIQKHWLPGTQHGYAVRVPGGLEIYP